MQIPGNKTGNPSLLALHKERKSQILRFMYSRVEPVLLVSSIDSLAFENSEVMRGYLQFSSAKAVPVPLQSKFHCLG